MQITDLEIRAGQLEKRCKSAVPAERLGMRPEVQRIIRALKANRQPVPRNLRRLAAVLDEEAFDDMFDNMPV